MITLKAYIYIYMQPVMPMGHFLKQLWQTSLCSQARGKPYNFKAYIFSSSSSLMLPFLPRRNKTWWNVALLFRKQNTNVFSLNYWCPLRKQFSGFVYQRISMFCQPISMVTSNKGFYQIAVAQPKLLKLSQEEVKVTSGERESGQQLLISYPLGDIQIQLLSQPI